MSVYNIEKILGAAGLSSQPAESTTAAVKDGQFNADPGAQKAASVDPDSPTFYRNPTPQNMLQERTSAKAKVEATARSGTGGSIFFRRKGGYNVSGSLGVVDFDLILEEETTYRAQVGQHPVQSGDPITDHIQTLPPTGRLRVLVSDYSLRYANGGEKAGEWDASQGRAMAAYEALKGLMRARTEVALVTSLEDFSAVNNQVVLLKLTTPKKAEDGDSLTFDIEYTQIYKVSKLKTTNLNVSIRVSDMKSAKNRAAAPEVSTGSQSPQNEDAPADDVLPTGDL